MIANVELQCGGVGFNVPAFTSAAVNLWPPIAMLCKTFFGVGIKMAQDLAPATITIVKRRF